MAIPTRIVASLLLILSLLDRGYSRTFLARTAAAPFRHYHIKSSVLDVRGGASKAARKKSPVARTATGKKKVGDKQKEKKPSNGLLQHYSKVLPLTRVYITAVALCTLLGLVVGAENAQAFLALDPMRVIYGFEFWRPLTAACFLGTPSISWLISFYYLFEYGSSLERAYGTAQHLIFLLTNFVTLAISSVLIGQPFFASSMVTAMLHVLSRAAPKQKVKWMVFTVPYWSLPLGLMTADVLQAQDPMAAIPHILGILSGHFYHFHKFIWPKIKGEDWLQAPGFVVKRLDPDAEKVVSTAPKQRKRQKGRKLGSE